MGSNSSKATGAVPVKRKYLNKENQIQYVKGRIVQNFLVVWLDATIDPSNKDHQYTMNQLRQIVNCYTTCTTIDDCKRFIEKKQDEQIFLVVSGRLGKKFVPVIHENYSLDSIYVFCGNPTVHKWTEQWKKIKLVSNQIELICQSLAKDVIQCDHDLIPTSILTLDDHRTTNLQSVDHSFMYSQLLKEILLDMTYNDREAIDVFTSFCRETYADNPKELEIISEFEKGYGNRTPIWWYTRECFAYRMLNRSLRLLDIDIIAMMGFFMKDIHQQISDLHRKQSDHSTTFTVFRGQRMPEADFEKLQKNPNGLLTFNSFLSTSTDPAIAMRFSKMNREQSNRVSVLFHMEINPTIMKTPFASLDHVGCYGAKEKEILFSMHTIFRITDIRKNQDLWDIHLKSLRSDDRQMTSLTEQIRREIGEGDAMYRLCQLMISLDELDKAEIVLSFLLSSTSPTDEQTLARIYRQQGYIKYKLNRNDEAKSLYEQACAIQEKSRPISDVGLAITYNNLGLLYAKLNETSKALAYHKKALAIRENRLDPQHQDLATTYNNIGLIYDQSEDYTTALLYYEKTLNIYQNSLPLTHPWLATILKNIGLAAASLKKYELALNHLRKAWEIRQISLPNYHPSIVSICINIGDLYQQMKDHPSALTFYERALTNAMGAANLDHHKIATIYHSMSKAHYKLQQSSEALRCAEQAVQFGSKTLPPNDRDFLIFKNNLEHLQADLS